MQSNPYVNPYFYSNIRDETACIYAPKRKSSQVVNYFMYVHIIIKFNIGQVLYAKQRIVELKLHDLLDIKMCPYTTH